MLFAIWPWSMLMLLFYGAVGILCFYMLYVICIGILVLWFHESQEADGALASKVLAIKEKTLSALDRTFRIEMSFMESMAGGAGQDMLLQKVAATLPSPAKPCSPAETLSKLGSLFSSQLYAFPNKQAQQSAALIRSAVTQISLGRRPTPLDAKCGSAVRQCYEQMAFYLSAEVELDGEKKTVYGKPALEALHAAMAKRVASKMDYSMKDLSYGRFHWLLTPEQAVELKEWTKALMPSWDGDLTVVGGNGADDDDNDPGQGGARKRARITEASVEAEVDDAFA